MMSAAMRSGDSGRVRLWFDHSIIRRASGSFSSSQSRSSRYSLLGIRLAGVGISLLAKMPSGIEWPHSTSGHPRPFCSGNCQKHWFLTRSIKPNDTPLLTPSRRSVHPKGLLPEMPKPAPRKQKKGRFCGLFHRLCWSTLCDYIGRPGSPSLRRSCQFLSSAAAAIGTARARPSRP